ncbi:MAG: TraR/DksA C4-type zinc finger protein [Deltaproteobacteria bacterium]|jgi:DnaK suppressor protein|nr:TraR/DksA C4-type zinc finger protein [Deltaproteobacteria bacterium]
MKKKDLKYLKKILIQQLMELLDRSDCSLDGLEETDNNLSDLLDRASQISEREFSHHLCSREKLYMRRIERSLQDIEDGVYGLCDQCEEDISFQRLKARPTARYCIGCKTQLEKMEKLTGVDAT